MTEHTIASCDWDACADCKHVDAVNGGCDVPTSQFEDNLEYIPEYIVCGSWEAEEVLR